MTHTTDNRDWTTHHPTPLLGRLAVHPTGTRKSPRRSNGQVRASEKQDWRAEARHAVAALKLVTVR